MTNTTLWSARVRDDGPVRVIELTGELDLAAAEELRDLLVDQLDRPGLTTLVADLAAVTFLDSAALGIFVHAYQHAGDTGTTFALAAPTRAVRRVLDISGVYEILVR